MRVDQAAIIIRTAEPGWEDSRQFIELIFRNFDLSLHFIVDSSINFLSFQTLLYSIFTVRTDEENIPS